MITVISSFSGRLRWTGNVARMKKGGSTFKILIFKPTRKRLSGSPACKARTPRFKIQTRQECFSDNINTNYFEQSRIRGHAVYGVTLSAPNTRCDINSLLEERIFDQCK